MKYRVDFILSKRFGVVEKTVFSLVLRGLTDIETISYLLQIYSDEVIANSIKRLVNFQVLKVDIEQGNIELSSAIHEILLSCNGELELGNLMADSTDSILVISDDTENNKADEIKRQILKILVPGIELGFISKSIDFIIMKQEV